MRPRTWLLCTQLLVCVALGVSAALYVHYLDPADSDFCGLRSGCEAVRKSPLSYFFGTAYVSLPLFSVLAQVLLLALSLRRGTDRAHALGESALPALWALPELTLFAAAGLGGVIAVGLIGYQALAFDQFCTLCLIVDLGAILAALCALAWARAVRGEPELPRSPILPSFWLAIAALLIAAPPLWNQVRPVQPVPAQILALYQPGKINVVEFADFECPYCRRLHQVLQPLLQEYGTRVAFQRRHLPLDMHAHAEPAARAALCAEAQGKGEEMADRLFSITLSSENVSAAAEALRLDPLRYDSCLNAPETTDALARDAALLPEDQFEGLPMTYVGGDAILGVATEAKLRDSFERALRPARASLSAPVYVALVGLLLGLLCWFGRAEPAASGAPRPA